MRASQRTVISLTHSKRMLSILSTMAKRKTVQKIREKRLSTLIKPSTLTPNYCLQTPRARLFLSNRGFFTKISVNLLTNKESSMSNL